MRDFGQPGAECDTRAQCLSFDMHPSASLSSQLRAVCVVSGVMFWMILNAGAVPVAVWIGYDFWHAGAESY